MQAIEAKSVVPGLDGVGRGDDRARLDVLGEDELAVAAISDDDFEGFGTKQRRRCPTVRSGGQEMRHFKQVDRARGRRRFGSETGRTWHGKGIAIANSAPPTQGMGSAPNTKDRESRLNF